MLPNHKSKNFFWVISKTQFYHMHCDWLIGPKNSLDKKDQKSLLLLSFLYVNVSKALTQFWLPGQNHGFLSGIYLPGAH